MAGGIAVAAPNQVHYAHLIDNSRPWWKNRRILLLNAWITLLLITSTTNGFDGSMMNGLQSLEQWRNDFNNPSGGKLGLLNAIQNIGSLAGYPFAPYISDTFGRKKSIILGAFFMVIATIVQTASQNVGMFIGARFLIGFGLSFASNAAPLLVTELAYPTQRAVLTSMYNGLWLGGATIAAWTTFGTFRINSSWSWRVPSAIQGLPSVVQCLLLWFIPESPRWLVNKGLEQKARDTIAYYHADGNQDDPLVTYQMEEIKAAIALDSAVSSQVGYRTLFATPGNRRRMRVIIAISFFSQWSGNGIISYYQNKVYDLLGITGSSTQLLINGVLQIFNLICVLIASFYVDRVGRRKLFIWSTAGMLVTWTVQTVCFSEVAQFGTQTAAHAFIAFIFLYSVFYDMAYSPLICSYTVEILPYALRAKGYTVAQFTVSLALIFNQYVNPIGLAAIGWKYYLVYLCWLVFELLFVIRYIIETKNRTLEETAAIFDGDEKVAQLEQHGDHGISPFVPSLGKDSQSDHMEEKIE